MVSDMQPGKTERQLWCVWSHEKEPHLVERLGDKGCAILVGPGEGVGEVLGLDVVLRAGDHEVARDHAILELLLFGPHLVEALVPGRQRRRGGGAERGEDGCDGPHGGDGDVRTLLVL